jgi:hypothetical protein
MIAEVSWSGGRRRAGPACRLVVLMLRAVVMLSVLKSLHPFVAVAAPVPVTPSTPKVVEVSVPIWALTLVLDTPNPGSAAGEAR